MRKLLFPLVAILLGSVLSATTFVVPSDAELFRKADGVVVATVIGSHAALTPHGVMTVTESRIEQVIKGSFAPGSVLATEAPGGTIGGITKEIHGTPKYAPGAKVLLFVFEWKQGHWATVDLAVGKFEFETDVRGRDVLVRSDDIVGWDQSFRPFAERRRAAAGFLGYLRTLATAPVAPESTYFIDAAPLLAPVGELKTAPSAEGTVQADAIVPPASNYIMEQGGTNFRWNSFPATAVFRSYGHGTVLGAADALTAAASNWSNDCGSNVSLANGGASQKAPPAGLAGNADGENTIRWEVDLAGILDFTCTSNSYSGVLGIGGPNAIGGTHTFDGVTYHAITEGDVDMNRGIAGCPIVPQSVRNAAATHEIGHTLNFRHSDKNRADNGACSPPLPCSNTSLMTASLPQGVSSLQQWDVDAVRAVYPGGACGGAAKADFNGDGTSDIFWRHDGAGGTNAVWTMADVNIANSFVTAANPDLTWKIEGVGDFDGDGQVDDLIWRNYGPGGANAIWRFDGGVIVATQMIAANPDTTWKIVGVGDFDQDGRIDDLLWRNSSTGLNAVWTFQGATVVSSFMILANTDLAWQVGGVGEFDGDGYADDIVWRRDAAGGTNAMWFTQGSNITFTGIIAANADLNWDMQGVGDYDGDGRNDDLLWRNTSTGQDAIWFFQNTSITRSSIIQGVTDLAWKMVGPR